MPSEDLRGCLDAVMNRDLAIGEQGLERKLVHLGQSTRLGERQALFAKQRDGKLPPHLRLAEVRRGENVVGNRDRHDSGSLYRDIPRRLRLGPSAAVSVLGPARRAVHVPRPLRRGSSR